MVGHVLQQAGHERIMQVVYSFHMPMLFILSGYFISNKKSFREFAVSRAVRLLIPYIKCCVILIIGKSLIAALLGKDIVFTLTKKSKRTLRSNPRLFRIYNNARSPSRALPSRRLPNYKKV